MGKFVVAGVTQIETIVKVDKIPVEFAPLTRGTGTICTSVGGDAYNEGAIREMRAAGDDSPGPDNAVFADDAAIEQDRAHADDGIITDGGAVYDGIVADGDAFP